MNTSRTFEQFILQLAIWAVYVSSALKPLMVSMICAVSGGRSIKILSAGGLHEQQARWELPAWGKTKSHFGDFVDLIMWRKITQPAADLENEYEHCGRAHINADTMMMRCYSYVPITSFITQSRASFLQLNQAGPTTGTILFLYRFPVLNLSFFLSLLIKTIHRFKLKKKRFV